MLRIRREAAGISREELARQAGVARSTIYLVEDRLTDTRIGTLIKIAKALRVSPAELLLAQ